MKLSREHINVLQNDNGVALLIAVSVISLLVAVTLQFSKDMRQELIGSANMLSTSRMNAMVKSGYNLAEAVLQKDSEDNTFDTIHDSWAEFDTNYPAQLYSSGKLEILVTDLGGRLQINSLINSDGEAKGEVAKKTRETFLRLLLSGDFGDISEEQATLIVDAITDWIDKDDSERGIEETESSYYLSRKPSYFCNNGPIEFIEDLLLVRGISADLYYGNDEFKGLRELVTAYGNDGKININTAPAAVLKALGTEMSDELAEKMVEFRQDVDNKDLLQNSNWYVNIQQWPGDVQLDSTMVTTSSSYFRIIASAANNDMEKTLEATVNRLSDGKIRMISRKVE